MTTTKQPRRFRLLQLTSRDLRANWRLLTGIVATVALPIAILSVVASTDATISAYSSIATLLMNLALIWAIIRVKATQPTKLKQAYFEGTAVFVQFVIVAVILALQFIPAAIGLLIYTLGTSGTTVTVSAVEQALFIALAVVLALPTLYWLTRYVFSPYLLVAESLSPREALRESKALSRGNFWYILKHLVFITAIIILVLVVPSLVIALLGGVGSNLLVAGLQLIVTLLLLPFLNLYLYNLYLGLVGHK
jgi:hypothetical protein